MRRGVIVPVLVMLASAAAVGQTAPSGTAVPPQENRTPAQTPGQGAAADTGVPPVENPWSFYASASFYLVPDGRDYVQPTFMADRDWLHLELRYNYEALDTGSAWCGVNFSDGEELTWELTPMIGAAFGDTTGLAPGYKFSVSWWRLEFSTEGEFFFDLNEASDSFFYSWSELSLSPVEWFRFGVAVQRTRVSEEHPDVQIGLLAGVSIEALDLTANVFNLDEDTPTLVFSIGLTF